MVTMLTREELIGAVEYRNRRLRWLKTFGRFTEGFQIIVLATFGQNIYSGGAQHLDAPHWRAAREFFGGYQGVGISLIVISLVGLLGLFSLAWTDSDWLYNTLMWGYSLAAFFWFVIIGITHHLAHSGSTGLWSLGLAGMFFLFSRIAITVSSGITEETHRGQQQ
jgi:hypothetical protein